MKKFYIFSFLIVLFSAVLISGCGKQVYIAVVQDTPEYSISMTDAKSNKDITFYEGKGYKVSPGKTVKIHVTFKEGWDPTKAKIFAGETELDFIHDDFYSVDNMWVAQLKVESDITVEVRNLVKRVYTVKMPTSPETENYRFYNGTTPINAESLTVTHGDSITITVLPLDGYALPQYFSYELGDTFNPDGVSYRSAFPVTDLYEKPIYVMSDRALMYKFSNITSNFAIGLTSSCMPDSSFSKRIKLDLPFSSEYALSVSVYKEYTDGNGELIKTYESSDDLYNKDLYVNFNIIFPPTDYVKDLPTKTIIVKGDNGTWEYTMETEGQHKDYFIIPAEKVKSDLIIRLKEKAIDDDNLDDGKYYGTFDNSLVTHELYENFSYKFAFTKGYIYGLECYTYGGKVYLTAGDTLFIPRIFGDNFTLTTTNITLAREMYKENELQEDYDFIKYTVQSIESNDFTIELSTSSVVTIPYADLKDDFKVEYRIGYDTTAPFIEITNESASIITVDNLQPLIIKLTSKHAEPFWANFDLSRLAYIFSSTSYPSGLNYLHCKTESAVGESFSTVYPENGIYFYSVAWFTGDTEIFAR